MKRAAVAAALSVVVLAGCGGGGKSKSYRLGQYDGPKLASKVTDVSPDGVAKTCRGRLNDYLVASKLRGELDSLTSPEPGVSVAPDVASTPDFTIKISDIGPSDYLNGCKSALKAKLR